jgi:hypothetical protein
MSKWPTIYFIGEASSPAELVEQLRNADLNRAYEEVAGEEPEVQDFAAEWDREADEARETALREQQGEA